MYEVASKRVNIIDCEVDVIEGSVLNAAPRPCKELNQVKQSTIIKHLGKFSFSDMKAPRKELIEDLCAFLQKKGLQVERSCIPSIIIEKKYPIEVLTYSEERDFYELLGRMLWIHEQYDSVIGILAGVMDPEVAAEIESSYRDVFLEEEEVTLMLS